ncbi:phage late control D family protein [Nocardia sp. bgisy118]|uniref:phage late control D family protein n=1 Tax=Nocardia sp. bgisy118 TaxID=3413786 RepID=UPI003F4A7509
MKHDSLRVEIDGAEIDDLYRDLLSLEIELDDQLAAMFRITMALLQSPDGSWPYLDDPRFSLWRRVVVTAGLEDDEHQLIVGYITHLRPSFGTGLEQCRLDIWGMDATALMDRVDRLKDWPNKTDSDIATEIFQGYGLAPEVTGTDIVHDEELSTIIQRETDIQLLRRMALRNGFECFVDGDTGYFRTPAVDTAPQPVLSVLFGAETTVNRFELDANALTPSEVTMCQLDHVSGEVLTAQARPGRRPGLGAEPASSCLAPGMEPGLVQIGRTVTTGNPEMSALCDGLLDQGSWFVTGRGEVAANQYGAILRPRATVTIKGVGETHSGVYYVAHVTHRFTAAGYLQSFRVKRNALMPIGDEDFAGESGGLLGALVGGL